MLKITALIIVLIVLLGGGYYFYQSSINNSSQNKSQQKVTLRLAWLHQAQFAGFYVAKEKGFYKDAGLDVELQEYEEGLNPSQELVEGKVDFSLISPLEVVSSVSEGIEIKAVGVVYQTAPLAYATLKTSGIKSPADFRGKVLGAKGGNYESKIKYKSILQSFNMSEDDATIKDADYSMDEADDLTTGRVDLIDLYRTDQPYLMRQKGVDFELLLPENFGFTGYGDTLTTTNALIKENPGLVKAFVQASFRGWDYAMKNPEEALEIVKKYENKDYADPEREKYILEQSIPLIKPTGAAPTGSMSFLIWNQIVEQAKNSRIIEPGFDASSVFTNQFLQP